MRPTPALPRRLPRRGVHHAPGSLRALLTGALTPGGRRAAFEQALAAAAGVHHAIATGSGRGALAMLLRALLDQGRLQQGDGLVLPALTFHAVPEVVRRAGLRVLFADVDPADLQTGPAQVEPLLRQGARAVLATHLMGLPADLAGLRAQADAHGLLLLEDAAQAFGARTATGPVGSQGLCAMTSLETVKPLNAFGGGALLTDDHELARALRRAALALPPGDPSRLARKVALGHVEATLARPLPFGLVGWPLLARGPDDGEGLLARYKAGKRTAGNHEAALSPGQAQAGLASLRHLPAHLDQRRAQAEQLLALLPDAAWRPRLRPGDQPSWYQVVVRARELPGLRAAARRAGVDLGPGALTDLSQGACPVAAAAAADAVQLPAHPGLRPSDLAHVAATVGPWLA